MYTMEMINEAARYIRERIVQVPRIGMILGSGLGILGDDVSDPVTIPYSAIPHFPRSTVEGHAGQLVIGELEGRQVLVMQGRFHYYEGYEMYAVTFLFV